MIRGFRVTRVMAWAGLSLVVGCVPAPRPPATAILLTSVDPVAGHLADYLEAHDGRVARREDGDAAVEPGVGTRAALIAYMRLARLRFETCAENIANVDTTRDVDGKPSPFRRRRVSVSADGSGKVEADPSPFLRRYQPGAADADAAGFVAYPNVDVTVENVDCSNAAMDYLLAAEALRRLEPGIVIVPLAATASK